MQPLLLQDLLVAAHTAGSGAEVQLSRHTNPPLSHSNVHWMRVFLMLALPRPIGCHPSLRLRYLHSFVRITALLNFSEAYVPPSALPCDPPTGHGVCQPDCVGLLTHGGAHRSLRASWDALNRYFVRYRHSSPLPVPRIGPARRVCYACDIATRSSEGVAQSFQSTGRLGDSAWGAGLLYER
ncbi:hypothetical protein K466DRAFT_393469 [Polyporus arcularius HHB13444]|uniref:Uncharacterized protein n=1 Tax=Polyporus arcularius HHB13444 TaxID=1314778 RepID=A0A5C3PPU5_9APHY|nr:hypothetical protein K466DRAFT_393469 [Polyporus arcularius HHB13444]